MRDVDVAWFAGVFEGEGCFSIERNGATRLTVAMTDRDIIERIHSLFPTTQALTVVQPKPAKAGYGTPKLRYTWRIGQPDEVRRITELILPYLGERRSARAREVLEHLASRPGVGGFQRAKTHGPHGHEYTPENTTYKGGAKRYRVCRTCAKTWWTTENAKRRERSTVE